MTVYVKLKRRKGVVSVYLTYVCEDCKTVLSPEKKRG